jgi:hypothetical protein
MQKLQFDTRRSQVKTCPCGRSNKDGKFAPFKGFEDKGYCHSCGETFFPDNTQGISSARPNSNFAICTSVAKSTTSTKSSTEVSYLPFDVFEKSVEAHEKCNLFPFLEKLFRKDLAKWLCRNYLIGANRVGDTVFWQVDKEANVRQAKVIQYHPATGKRSKEVPVFFVGKRLLKNRDANLKQCFFNEYNLNDSLQPVAICESEKTAVIASVFFPDLTWLATGGKFGCSWTEKGVCKVLEGKNVILFPDGNAYELWTEKARLLSVVAGCKVVVSDIIERNATTEEKTAGLDIADFLLRNSDETNLALTDYQYPLIWDFKY